MLEVILVALVGGFVGGVTDYMVTNYVEKSKSTRHIGKAFVERRSNALLDLAESFTKAQATIESLVFADLSHPYRSESGMEAREKLDTQLEQLVQDYAEAKAYLEEDEIEKN